MMDTVSVEIVALPECRLFLKSIVYNGDTFKKLSYNDADDLQFLPQNTCHEFHQRRELGFCCN